MANAAILVGWKRAQVGREEVSLKGFGEYTNYLASLVREKRIEGFEPVFIRPHGGELNGFILIKAEESKLAQLRASEAWKDWEVWGDVNLQGFCATECIVGDGVGTALSRFAKALSR